MLLPKLMPVLLVALVACGSDDDETAAGESDRTTTTSTTSTTTVAEETTTTTTAGGGGDDMPAAISLTIEVTSDGSTPVRSGTLSCGAAASGTGHFADPAAAQAACAALENAAAVRRLVDGPDLDLICIEIYGGPDVATITGQIGGQPVDATITRTDGCAMSDWDMLEALVGAPSADF